MNLSKELLEKAKAANSAAELKQMAKAENIELTAEEAERYFADLHKTGELDDNELDNVSGGCGGGTSGDTPKYNVGDHVYYCISKPGGTRGFPIQTKVNAVVQAVLGKTDGVFSYRVTGGVVKTENELNQ